ncbi:MAG: thrombospondin type 3 repeat-containing protein [Pseudomonadota bacterium]
MLDAFYNRSVISQSLYGNVMYDYLSKQMLSFGGAGSNNARVTPKRPALFVRSGIILAGMAFVFSCYVIPAVVLAQDNQTFTLSVGELRNIRRGASPIRDGQVRDDPSAQRINCGDSPVRSDMCTFDFPANETVTLRAFPAQGFFLARWADDCTGTGPCVLVMDSDKEVDAVFEISEDADGDGIQDDDDNCPSVANNSQLDTDSDGLGDPCDSDDDNDTLTDERELELGTDPLERDSDRDGFDDASELEASTDPLDADNFPELPSLNLAILQSAIANSSGTSDEEGTGGGDDPPDDEPEDPPSCASPNNSRALAMIDLGAPPADPITALISSDSDTLYYLPFRSTSAEDDSGNFEVLGNATGGFDDLRLDIWVSICPGETSISGSACDLESVNDLSWQKTRRGSGCALSPDTDYTLNFQLAPSNPADLADLGLRVAACRLADFTGSICTLEVSATVDE